MCVCGVCIIIYIYIVLLMNLNFKNGQNLARVNRCNLCLVLVTETTDI